MLEASLVMKILNTGGVSLATGVPDSLLAHFCQYLEHPTCPVKHISNTSEGAAIALAAGHHLSTGELGLVYLQNSGLGNAVNPLTSLTSSRVCGIPVVLMIGWRGEINEAGDQIADEPQHVHQGAITLPLLDLLDIPFWVLSSDYDEAERQILDALTACRSLDSPVALVARKNLFTPSTCLSSYASHDYPSRESFIQKALASTPATWPVIATTGKTAREVYELSKTLDKSDRSFLSVGAMGHAIQIAAGLAFGTSQRVICFDGDGAGLMHLGSLAVSAKAERLVHIMINNGVHESVGSQPIADQTIAFARIAQELGYAHTYRVSTLGALEEALQSSYNKKGSFFIEAMTVPGSRENLARPKETPKFNKERFMHFVSAVKVSHDAL